MFKLMNPAATAITFKFEVENFNNNGKFSINPNVQTVNAYSVMNYIIKWQVFSSADVRFFLQVFYFFKNKEDNFLVSYPTPTLFNNLATKYFDNTQTGLNENMRLYINNSSANDIHLSALIFKISIIFIKN